MRGVDQRGFEFSKETALVYGVTGCLPTPIQISDIISDSMRGNVNTKVWLESVKNLHWPG